MKIETPLPKMEKLLKWIFDYRPNYLKVVYITEEDGTMSFGLYDKKNKDVFNLGNIYSMGSPGAPIEIICPKCKNMGFEKHESLS